MEPPFNKTFDKTTDRESKEYMSLMRTTFPVTIVMTTPTMPTKSPHPTRYEQIPKWVMEATVFTNRNVGSRGVIFTVPIINNKLDVIFIYWLDLSVFVYLYWNVSRFLSYCITNIASCGFRLIISWGAIYKWKNFLRLLRSRLTNVPSHSLSSKWPLCSS